MTGSASTANETDIEITPLHCHGPCDPAGPIAVWASMMAILVVGALIMKRWRDMPLVAAVAFAVWLFGWMALEPWALADVFLADPRGLGKLAFAYAMTLLVTAGVHAVKRALGWLPLHTRKLAP